MFSFVVSDDVCHEAYKSMPQKSYEKILKELVVRSIQL